MGDAHLVPAIRGGGAGEPERAQVVLVLDDDTRVREAMVDMLADAGFRAVGVADAREALASVARIDPDLILLDLMMPSMDGADFLVRLRALALPREVPVLIVSGIGRLVQGIAPEQARSQNIRGVISKPVEYATLISEVSYIIGPPRGR
jgi:chemotaxis family two-component system response regulator PixG